MSAVDLELKNYRELINEVDCQLLKLLSTRAKLAFEIGETKKKSSVDSKVYSLEREKSVIENILSINNSQLTNSDLSAIYHEIIAACRNVQINQKHHDKTKVAIQGIKGCHTEAAMSHYCQQHRFFEAEYVYVKNSENVVNAVINAECDYGIVAMNNELAGMVAESIAAIQNKPCYLVEWLSIPIRHCLLVKPEAVNLPIQTIASHAQALKQCRQSLDANYSQCKLQKMADTAESAQLLALGKLDLQTAVLAPEVCAQHYGLHVLRRDMQDSKTNRTWFAIIRRHEDGE